MVTLEQKQEKKYGTASFCIDDCMVFTNLYKIYGGGNPSRCPSSRWSRERKLELNFPFHPPGSITHVRIILICFGNVELLKTGTDCCLTAWPVCGEFFLLSAVFCSVENVQTYRCSNLCSFLFVDISITYKWKRMFLMVDCFLHWSREFD